MAGIVKNDLNSDNKIHFSELNKTLNESVIKNYITKVIGGTKLHFNRSIDDLVLNEALSTYRDNYEKILSQDNLFLDFDSYSYISDDSISNIAPICRKLKKINLKSCVNITDKSLEYLAKHCNFLEEINLSWCDITAKSLFIIADNFPNLERINVSSCYITDDGIEHLLEKCKKLQILGLAWCKSITDKTIKAMINFPGKLKVFDIRGNEKITPMAFSELFLYQKDFSSIHLKRCYGVNTNVIDSLTSVGDNLVKLNLRGCYRNDNIDNKTVSNLFIKCHNIKSLDIAWHEYVTSDTLNVLADNCANIKAVDLSGCELVNELALKNLVIKCHKLETIILFKNKLISSHFVDKLRLEFKRINFSVYDYNYGNQ